MGQRLTGMSSQQASFPVVPSKFKFAQYGKSGAWVSELLPHTAKMADDLTIRQELFTEAINHDPAVTMMQTGAQLGGRPSMGSWVSYGIGSGDRESARLCSDDFFRVPERPATLRPALGQRLPAQ